MLPTALSLLLAVIPSLPPPPPMAEGCAGQTLGTCKGGWTGPMCDMQCQAGQPCDFRLYCHSWGATYGLSTAGTFLFPLDLNWSSWLVEAKLRGFILDVESLSGDGGGDGDGCACTAEGGEQNPCLWPLVAGIMVLFRRSRWRVACATVALVSSPVLNGCGPETNGEETNGSTETTLTSSTGPETSSSTGTLPEAFQRFGPFYWESYMVGFQNPPDMILAWMTLEIHGDGTLTEILHGCTSLSHTHQFTWQDVGGGTIRVVPGEVSPSGTFLWGADQVETVTISAGNGCDDIMVLVDYTDESGKTDLLDRFVPGELCAEGMKCDFTFVWCDGKGPDACE